MSNGFVQRGGWWVVGQFVLLVGIASLAITGRTSAENTFFNYGCWLCFAIAALSGLGGIASLGRNLTPFPKPAKNTRFVQHGIYRHIRHPLYVAVICSALGWSLFWASWLALAGTLILAAFLDAKARHEERWLCERFPEYADYQRRVRRFIPWIY